MSFYQAKAFINHVVRAKGPHGVHSPFVFELITRVLVPERQFYCFHALEAERKKWLADKRTLHIDDFGAGSQRMKTNERKVSDIARHSLQSPEGCRLLFKLAQHMEVRSVLELGTSLGLTAAYFAHLGEQVKVVSIEGAPALVEEARGLFRRMSLPNASVMQGMFDNVLQESSIAHGVWDMVYIDGHHLKAPTLRYAQQLWPTVSAGGCMVFDDIHWSREMEEAWTEFIQRPDVTLSLDFFRFGIAFKNEAFSKEHMVLKLNA